MKLSNARTLQIASVTLLALSACTPLLAQAATGEAAKVTLTAPKDDQAARDLLRASALAIKNMEPVTFTAQMEGVGLPITLRGSADTAFVRSINPPTSSAFRAKGSLETMGIDRPNFEFSITQGQRVQWYDHDAKVRWDAAWGSLNQQGKLTEGQQRADQFMKLILPRPLLDPEPFAFELREDRAGDDIRKLSMVFDGEEKIGETSVRIIRVIVKEGQNERRIGIADDKLPRLYEEIRNPGAQPQKRVFRILNLQPIKDFKPEQIPLPAISGYREEKLDVATSRPQQDPAAPSPQRGFAQVRAGGPAIGQLAPDFELKNAANENVALSGLKDQFVVVSFISPLVPSSVQAQSAVVAASKLLEGKASKPVKYLALSSREGNIEPIAAALKAMGSSQTILTGADRTASLYNVRGFPSVAVIDPQGRVAMFLEGQQPEGRVISEIVTAITGAPPISANNPGAGAAAPAVPSSPITPAAPAVPGK